MLVELVGIQHLNVNTWPAHTHNLWEIVLNLDGNGMADIDGRQIPFSPGTVFCLPPGALHSKTSAGFFRDLYVHVDDSRLPREPIIIRDNPDGDIKNIMSLMLKSYNSSGGSPAVNFTLLSSLYEALYCLLAIGSEKDSNVLAEQLRDLLVRNFTDCTFTVGSAYEHFPYSPDHMRRLFDREYHISPTQFLNTLKINYAKQMFSAYGGDLRIADAAREAGFSDPQYFSRIFRKLTGISPQEYVKSLGSRGPYDFERQLAYTDHRGPLPEGLSETGF